MSKDAVAAIIGCIDTGSPKGLRDRFFLALMYDTAARDGEMLKMKLSDINPENKTVYLFGKGSKPRLVPVSKETLHLFELYKSSFHHAAERMSICFIRNTAGKKRQCRTIMYRGF